MEQHDGGVEDECDGRGTSNLTAQYEKRQTRFGGRDTEKGGPEKGKQLAELRQERKIIDRDPCSRAIARVALRSARFLHFARMGQS